MLIFGLELVRVALTNELWSAVLSLFVCSHKVNDLNRRPKELKLQQLKIIWKWRMISIWKEESLKKIRASKGFEPVTSAIPVRCSTNWAKKPHIGSEANLLSSYLPWGVKWCEVYMRYRYRGGHGFESRRSPDLFRLLLSNCLNWKINCDDHSSLSYTTGVQI